MLGYHSYSGTAVKGADPAIEQFAPSSIGKTGTMLEQTIRICPIEEFKTEFDTFLASSNNYFLIETHPDTFIEEDGDVENG